MRIRRASLSTNSNITAGQCIDVHVYILSVYMCTMVSLNASDVMPAAFFILAQYIIITHFKHIENTIHVARI